MRSHVWGDGVGGAGPGGFLYGQVMGDGHIGKPHEQNDRHHWKHYLPATLLADGNKRTLKLHNFTCSVVAPPCMTSWPVGSVMVVAPAAGWLRVVAPTGTPCAAGRPMAAAPRDWCCGCVCCWWLSAVDRLIAWVCWGTTGLAAIGVWDGWYCIVTAKNKLPKVKLWSRNKPSFTRCNGLLAYFGLLEGMTLSHCTRRVVCQYQCQPI